MEASVPLAAGKQQARSNRDDSEETVGIYLKLERSTVSYPLWRKKVDSSLWKYNGTTIPNWACRMWGIQDAFSQCISRNDASSKVQIEFMHERFDGAVTIAKEGRRTPAYRLWFSDQLSTKLKDVFLMSFVRDLEDRLRKARGNTAVNIEDDIPFWEFLDIEYNQKTRAFLFGAHYTQKPGVS